MQEWDQKKWDTEIASIRAGYRQTSETLDDLDRRTSARLSEMEKQLAVYRLALGNVGIDGYEQSQTKEAAE